MSEPLNRLLYRQLQRVFGRVRICNEGQAMVARYGHDAIKDRDELIITDPGEYYLVCCPRCSDTRFRLYINHRWGKRDEQGRRNLWLAICYNEDCYHTAEARWGLYAQLSEIEGVLDNAPIAEGIEVTEAKEMELPGPVFRLDRLEPNHAANRYLAGRFYDPEMLGRFYRVGYCPTSPYYLATNRIIAPVYQDGILKGWQARYLGECDWKSEDAPPKWWSAPGMNRAKLLYNWDNARAFRTGVIVEGPGDVWSFGPMAMATFGSTMTTQQRRMFVAAFGQGSGVIMYDQDVQDKPSTAASYAKLIEELRPQFRHGLASVILPAGADPGDLDRAVLRAIVAEQALTQKVIISWERR